MKEQKKEIADLLREDSQLLAMLAKNKPFYSDQRGEESEENSILPFGFVPQNYNTPYITIQGGEESLRGNKLYDEVFYIRVSNSIKKSFVKIDQICERIKEILDGADLRLSESVLVKIIYEYTSPDLTDEAMNVNYKEMRFRLLLL